MTSAPSPLVTKMRSKNATPAEMRRVAGILRRLNHHRAAEDLEAEAQRGEVDQQQVFLATHHYELLELARRWGRVRVCPLGDEPFELQVLETPGWYEVIVGPHARIWHSSCVMHWLLERPSPYTVRV